MPLQVAMRLFNDFTNQYQNITKPFEGQLSEEEVKKGTEAIFKVAVAFEKLVLNYSRYHLNETNLLKKMTDGRMGELECPLFIFVTFCGLDKY